jgi:UbiA prenyltransferase family protein
MPTLRTLLILGRVSNLPTVWSNCLAGWWLGGGGNHEKLPLLFAGVTLLYVGGMFLNDAFDADFDRQHRRERPIPSEAVSARFVWRAGLVELALGSLCLIGLGEQTGGWGILLLIGILVYDAIHKLVTFSPVLMGSCRLLVYIIAASTAAKGLTGLAVWSGLALMAYVVGLSYLARRESFRGPLTYWPLVSLAAPVGLALIVNTGIYQKTGILLSAILVLWMVRSLYSTLQSNVRNIGRTVANLLAGIVLVDLLAVADATGQLGVVFTLLFAAAVLAQRFVPAT